MRLTRGRQPPQIQNAAWHYDQGGVFLTANTEEALTKSIFEYRMRNNLPIGDIERDVDDYYCSRWPDACQKEPKDYNPKFGDAPSNEPFLNRVARWAARLIAQLPRGGYTLVTQAEADNRNAICSRCPQNQSWRGKCSGCSASTTTILMQLRQMKSSKQQGNLAGCLVLGIDNVTGVWLPTDLVTISDGQRKQLPGNCWRLNA